MKALDQDARAVLRKHGIRFGQFTIFMPLLLKPAPTRLRLVLWSLTKGLSEFPESPPPGLVTIPVEAGAPEGADTMSGYRNAGDRAIRIDMLERLADMLRTEDSRGGFEAKADMLSITGMTLEQFAALMEGLGYKAEKGEREKVKAVTEVMPEAAKNTDADTPVMDTAQIPPEGGITQAPETETPADVPEKAADTAGEGVAPIAEEPAEAPQANAGISETAEGETAQGIAPDADIAGPDMEVFYTFTWGRAPRANAGNRKERSHGQGRPQGKGKKGGPRGNKGGDRGGKAQNYSARPPKPEKKIDPDNPFAAALMGLKDNS